MGGAMIDVMAVGARGRMGSLTAQTVAAQDDMRLVAAVDPAFSSEDRPPAPAYADVASALAAVRPQVAVEFSTPATVFGNTQALLTAGVHTVVGATGLSAAQVADLSAQSRRTGANLLVAPNFALGAVLLMRFAAEAARFYERAEIVELHGAHKLDAPSGTALRTAALMAAAPGSRLTPPAAGAHAAGSAGPSRGLVADGVAIHSVRLPGLVAHHEVLFGGTGEVLTLRHDTLSRESFMSGVLLAVRRVQDLEETVVGLENLLFG